jgi:hypothetical protein
MRRSLPFGPAIASRLRPRKPSGRRFPALAVAVAVLLGIFGHQSLAQQALSGDQIRALITGNTLQGSFMSKPLTMVFYPEGVVRGAIGLTGSDSGDWEIEGNNYCNEWVTYFSGVRRCYQWIPQGDGYLLKNVDPFKVRNIQGRIVEGMPKGY